MRTGRVNRASYFGPMLAAIRRYDYPAMRIHWGDREPAQLIDDVRWLFAFNLPCYGGGLQIAPQADAADGLLDVCTFHRGGLWHGFAMPRRCLPARSAGWPTSPNGGPAGCASRRTAKCLISSMAIPAASCRWTSKPCRGGSRWWSGPISFHRRVGRAQRAPPEIPENWWGSLLDPPYGIAQIQTLIGPAPVVPNIVPAQPA